MAGTPYGNSQWAEIGALFDAGFSIADVPVSSAFLLGKWAKTRQNEPHPMHIALYEGKKYRGLPNAPFVSMKSDGHILTVAPTRSGKGVGLIIPNLLNYDQTVIVIDPKGENFSKTVGYRVNDLKQEYWCFDPFMIKQQITLHGICVLKNVKKLFDMYDDTNKENAASSFLAEVSRIAEAIVIRKRDEKDPFFSNAAQTLIKDAIVLTIYDNPNVETPPLSSVRALLSSKERVNLLHDKISGKIADGNASNKDFIAYNAINEIKGYCDNRDVMSTVLMQTEFLEDDNVAAILDGNKKKCKEIFDPSSLNDKEKQKSIYLIIPPQHIERQARFLRLFITLCMDVVTRRNSDYDKLGRYSNVLFILDEIAQLGRLDCIQKAVALAAGYKLTLWMFWQDLSQLKGLYPEDWATFLSNAKLQQFFGCNDIETAKYISERCGPRTQFNYSQNEQFSTHGFYTDITTGVTTNKTAGELIRPSEILRADNSIIFHFCQGTFPFMCEKIKYYNDSPFKDRAEE